MKRARKVALINVHEHPHSHYSAHWMIYVDGEDGNGYDWRAELLSYEPVAWVWNGARTSERPEGAPYPSYPPDPPRGSGPEVYVARQKLIDIEFARCPQPQYLIDSSSGHTQTRDEADTAAQQWVLSRVGEHRRPQPLATMDGTMAEALKAEADLAAAAKDWGRHDKIRGLLVADGRV